MTMAHVYHTAHLRVHPEVIEQFRARLLRHARTSLDAEQGCLAFDVYEEKANPGLFFLYEVYEDDDALSTHRSSPHYLAFRDDLEDWVAERIWYFWNRCKG